MSGTSRLPAAVLDVTAGNLFFGLSHEPVEGFLAFGAADDALSLAIFERELPQLGDAALDLVGPLLGQLEGPA